MVKRELVPFGRSSPVYALLNSVFKCFIKVASDEAAVSPQPFSCKGWLGGVNSAWDFPGIVTGGK